MSNILTTQASGCSTRQPVRKSPTHATASRRIAAFGALMAVAFLTLDASAQFANTISTYARVKPGQLRVTVPANAVTSTLITNKVSMTGINSSGITYTVTGLPAGASYSVSPNPITASGSLNLTINTTSVADGIYTFSLNGTGTDTNGNPVSGSLLYTLQAGYIWNAPAGGNIATSGNWLGGTAPGATDDLIFEDVGATSLVFLPFQAANTNVLITANLTNGSVRFAQTNSTNKIFNVLINPGVTWALTGNNGFSFIRDTLNSTTTSTTTMTVDVAGTNGATLAVQNETGNFSLLLDNTIANTCDLSQLDNFKADVSIFGLGDFRLYPTFSSYDSNSIGSSGFPGGQPYRFIPTLSLARTNVIKGIFVDPYNYTNDQSRDFGLSFEASENAGTTTTGTMNLGISNIFLADGVDFGGPGSTFAVKYNTALLVTTNITGSVTNLTTNLMSTVFRNTNGTSRMSIFELGDGGGVNSPVSTKSIGNVNFANVLNGQVDILTDRMYLARDRQYIYTNNNPIYQGNLTVGNGVIDANTLVVGYRQFHQTNTIPPEIPQLAGYLYNGYCQGTLVVLSNTVIKVNNLLSLGVTAGSSAGEEAGGNNVDSGQIIVQNGGSLSANAVYVGGPSYGWSSNNILVFSNNSTFTLTNYCGSTNQGVNKLEFDAGSTLAVYLDATNFGPYIFASNFVTVGASTLNIQSIKNLASYSGPLTLMTYTGGGGAFTAVNVPAGVGSAALTFVTNSGLISMKLTIVTNTPKHIVWRGYSSGNWDLTTANWLDQNTGLHTNFANGDFVKFDDADGVPTLHLSGSTDIIPGPITMTNSLEYYTIDSAGGGSIFGTSTLTKSGSNGLEVDGGTTLNIVVNQGSFSGNSAGSIGSISLATNTVMNYSGFIYNGITCASVATLNGNGAGNLTVLGTGIVTNAGEWDGPFSIASGGQLYNNGNIGSDQTYLNLGTSITTSAGSLFVNNGNITAPDITINGTLVDTGAGVINMYGDTASGTRGLTIGTGGTFIPGGYGIGTTTIGIGFSSFSLAGRLLLSAGSTNIYKVDNSVPDNTQVKAQIINYGPNQSALSINGATLIVSNISAVPFHAGQTIQIGVSQGTAGSNTANSVPIILPPTPGPGLAWDLSHLLDFNTGWLGVIAVSTNPINIGFHATPGVSNTFITELTWPTNYIGWKLQLQTIALTNGLVNNPTNWTTYAPSLFTNDILFTNTFATNGTASGGTLYRLTYP